MCYNERSADLCSLDYVEIVQRASQFVFHRAQVLAIPEPGSPDLTVQCSNYVLSLCSCTRKSAFVAHQEFPVIEYQKVTGGSEEVTSQGKSSLFSTINILSVAMPETSYTDPTPTSHLSSWHQTAGERNRTISKRLSFWKVNWPLGSEYISSIIKTSGKKALPRKDFKRT